MTPDSPLTGVAALADRAVDGRRVALVMGVLGLLLAAVSGGGAELLLAGANVRPEGAHVLARLANDGPSPAGPPAHVAVVLVDGLRVDEAAELPSWQELSEHATTGQIRLRTPTLSRPFYHHLFTGVPSDISGVRTNRFSEHARFDSVTDRVRAAGGRVFIAADGLDWMRRMHGAPEDGGSDARGALGWIRGASEDGDSEDGASDTRGGVDGPLDVVLEEWREAAAPALLIVHYVATDGTAHADGIHAPSHRRALDTADALIARVARHGGATIFVLSDHGHRVSGGHGGAEPEVARSPILVRGPAGSEAGRVIEPPIDADTLAPSISLALGVPRPRAALGVALEEFGARPVPTDAWSIRAASIAHASRALSQEMLAARRRRLFPLALLLMFMALGPIKRAFGFDRSMLFAMSVPALVVLWHVLLGRPISLSAIDERDLHVARIFGLGVAAAAFAIASARFFGKGEPRKRTRRAAATALWAAIAFALLSSAAAGFALGPWALSPAVFYLPLLGCGAGAGAALVASSVLLGSALRDRR